MKELQHPSQGYLDQLPHMIWLRTKDETLHFNAEWKNYFGANYLSDWSGLIHHLDFHYFSRAELNAKAETVPWETTVRLRQFDGDWIWHRLMMKPFQGGWIGSAVNIHALKKVEDGQRFLAEAVLLLSKSGDIETRLRSIAYLLMKRFGGSCTLELKDGTTLTESALSLKEDRIKEILSLIHENHTHHSVPGATSIRTGGATLVNFEHDQQGMRSYLSCPMKNEESVFGLMTIVSTEETFGEADLHFTGELSRVIAPFLENARLVTELTMREEKLREAVEARDIFLSVCSHELKTPVTSLKLLSQITLRQLTRGHFQITLENVKEVFRKLAGQVDRLSSLIEDMLDISRMESGNFVFRKDFFSLTTLVRDIMEKYEVNFRELGISLSYEIEEDVKVYGDVVRIEQVILNIMNNAIKYGRLAPVEVILQKDALSAVIRVKDLGIGIHESSLEKIFQRFERVNQDANITGLGLGLYICKQIVESHQGLIEVNSTVDVGSTFSVYLPLKP